MLKIRANRAALFLMPLCAFFGSVFVAPLSAQDALMDGADTIDESEVRLEVPRDLAEATNATGEAGYFFGSTESYDRYSGADRPVIPEGREAERRPSSDSFLDNAFANQADSSGVYEENPGSDGKWLEDDISPLFPELKILDDVSSKSSLKRMASAERQYNEALHSLKAGELAAHTEKEKRLARKISNGEEWRNDELNERIARHMASARARHRAEAIGRLVKAIQLLDSIQNPSVLASEPYLDLKSRVYRQYVKQQFKSRNLQYCVEILESYLRLRPEHQKEAEAHRLLAACYRHQEVLADRMQDRPGSRDFKKRKNNHLMKYAFLAYGKDSPEYAAIERNVQRDLIETYAPDRRRGER